MLLISFAPNQQKPQMPSSQLASRSNQLDDLLNTGFNDKSAEPETVLVSKTILAVVAKVYLMAVSPSCQFWAKLSDEGKLFAVSKEDSLLQVIKEARDILVEEKVLPTDKKNPINNFIKLLEQFELELAKKKENEQGEQSPASLVLKNLTKIILDEKLKDLVIGAVIQQKEIYQNYLNEQERSPVSTPKQEKEREELRQALINIEQHLLSDRVVTPISSRSERETELILDPLTSFSFHRRETLVVDTKKEGSSLEQRLKNETKNKERILAEEAFRIHLERMQQEGRIAPDKITEIASGLMRKGNISLAKIVLEFGKETRSNEAALTLAA